MASIAESIDELKGREGQSISDLETARDNAIAAIAEGYTTSMKFYEGLDIDLPTYITLASGPIKQGISDLYDLLTDANERSGGSFSARPIVAEAFKSLAPIAQSLAREGKQFNLDLAGKRSALTDLKTGRTVDVTTDTGKTLANLRYNYGSRIGDLGAEQSRLDVQTAENEAERKLKFDLATLDYKNRKNLVDLGLDPNRVVSSGKTGGGMSPFEEIQALQELERTIGPSSGQAWGTSASAFLANASRRSTINQRINQILQNL